MLVHADRGAEHARADVGDAGELERALDGAVLAVGAVQHRKDHVVDGHRFQLAARARDQRFLHRDRGCAGVEPDVAGIAGRRLQRPLRLAVPAPVFVDADQHRLEPLPVDRREHVARRQQRDLVLRRTAAEQDDDARLLHFVLSSYETPSCANKKLH